MSAKEQKLIRGCIARDRDAQADLYSCYAPKMMVVCQRYARSRDEAEEILQEGFYLVFKSVRQFRHDGSLEGWIRKIIVNAALQRMRANSKLYPVLSIEPEALCIPDHGDILADLHVKELILLIQSLPASYRLIFNLYVFEGFKHREIAQLLGIAEGTSKSNLSSARAILQKKLSLKKMQAF